LKLLEDDNQDCWKMGIRKLVVPTVFIWYWRNSGGGIDLSAGGRSVNSTLQLNKRWCAVCMGFSGQLQCGEDNLFILC